MAASLEKNQPPNPYGLAATKNYFTQRLMEKAAVTYFRDRYCNYLYKQINRNLYTCNQVIREIFLITSIRHLSAMAAFCTVYGISCSVGTFKPFMIQGKGMTSPESKLDFC